MSVISNYPAMPNRFVILCRHLATRGGRGEGREDLTAMLSPQSLRRRRPSDEVTGKTIAHSVVSEALALELVKEDEATGRVTLAFDLAATDPEAVAGAVREQLERTLLDRETAERTNQGSVAVALAWLLTRDPAVPPGWHVNVKHEIQAEFPDAVNAFGLTDDSRYDNAIYWARYLGYAWRVGGETRKVVMPDPTEALARHLPVLMVDEPRLTIRLLMERWRERCPVLEGGWARLDVEEAQDAKARRASGQLSRSTSFALKRLERRGFLKLERPSDADTLLLDWAGSLEPVSHVRLAGA